MRNAEGFDDERPPAAVRISRPFWKSRFEVTNEQYARFDPAHEGRFEHRSSWIFSEEYLGWALDRPRQPVVRVSWNEAAAFCRWLSERTGAKVSLPTEAQWEHACRAGSSTPFSFGGLDADFSPFSNAADATIRELAYGGWRPKSPDLVPRDALFDDGALVTANAGSYRPNAWGLHDLHRNAAEWTRTAYRPYPYRDDDGRVDPEAAGDKVVRGGSWYHRPKRCRSAYRLATGSEHCCALRSRPDPSPVLEYDDVMARRSAGKKAAWIAGLGVVAVLGLGACFWKDFVAQRHLHRLRHEPKYLASIAEKPEGTPERRAVRTFLRTSGGAQALVSTLLNDPTFNSEDLNLRSSIHTHFHLAKSMSGLLQQSEGALIGVHREASVAFWKPYDSLATEFHGKWGHATGYSFKPLSAPALALFGLMGEIAGQEVDLPEYPDVRFRVLPLKVALEMYGKTARGSTPREFTSGHACLVYRPGALDPHPGVFVNLVPRWLEKLVGK